MANSVKVLLRPVPPLLKTVTPTVWPIPHHIPYNTPMAEDEGKEEEKKEDQFGFTLEGEEIGYVDLDGATFIAMKTARDTPGEYSGGYQDIPLVFELSESRETEDHYVITLSFRPQGTFPGAPGSEQFYVTKEGVVDLRQVLDLPRPLGKSRLPVILVGLVGVGAVVVVGASSRPVYFHLPRRTEGETQPPQPTYRWSRTRRPNLFHPSKT